MHRRPASFREYGRSAICDVAAYSRASGATQDSMASGSTGSTNAGGEGDCSDHCRWGTAILQPAEKLDVAIGHRRPSCTPAPPTVCARCPMARARSGRDTRRLRYSKMKSSSSCVRSRLGGDLQANIIGKLRERSHIADDHSLAQPERPLQTSRGLPDRRIAQVQHDVAGADVFDELFDGAKPMTRTCSLSSERADQLLDVEIRMRLPRPESCARADRSGPACARRAEIRRCACTA